jgi:hypothetical protein
MKFRIPMMLLVFGALSISTLAQCSNTNLKPVWDGDKAQFRCVNANNPSATVKDDAVQPVGDKAYCMSARDNLQAACPVSNEGKACRNEAKSFFNTCKRTKSDTAGTSANTRGTSKADASACMTTFQQQQQACASHQSSPAAPGQITPSNTCLQDAIAAQSKCLANSH